MKLKNIVKKGLRLATIYFIAILCMLLMAERVERLNEQERYEREIAIAEKIDK